jgi:hypothetical protein
MGSPSAKESPPAEYDFDGNDEPCWNCGGEGFVANCFDEIACMYPEDGCDLCMRRCEYCNPAKQGGAK